LEVEIKLRWVRNGIRVLIGNERRIRVSIGREEERGRGFLKRTGENEEREMKNSPSLPNFGLLGGSQVNIMSFWSVRSSIAWTVDI
jgi:hypothetical protein